MFLIFDNQIAGTTAQDEGLPAGFRAVEGMDAPLENLYWDGKAIALKPPKPNNTAYWDTKTKAWKTPPVASFSSAIPNSPDWNKLVESLENSPEWGRTYAASERTLKANTAYTTLMTVLGSLRKVETLQFALFKLREAMEGISGLGDFNPDEVDSINQKLKAAGFEFQI